MTIIKCLTTIKNFVVHQGIKRGNHHLTAILSYSFIKPSSKTTSRSSQFSVFVTGMASSITYKPVKLGVEVRGIDLKTENSHASIEKIIEDVYKYRLLIFKDQGIISGDRHVEISKWFGELESTFYKHPRSPHPDVFRVSNNEKEGCTNVGRTGWHIDGSFMEAPFDFAIYHMVSIPKVGATAFVGHEELLASMSPERRKKWERLWMVGSRSAVHPLIYSHPVTKKAVLCFHLGMTTCFIWNYKEEGQRVTDEEETEQIFQEIYHEIIKDNERLVYKHQVADL